MQGPGRAWLFKNFRSALQEQRGPTKHNLSLLLTYYISPIQFQGNTFAILNWTKWKLSNLASNKLRFDLDAKNQDCALIYYSLWLWLTMTQDSNQGCGLYPGHQNELSFENQRWHWVIIGLHFSPARDPGCHSLITRPQPCQTEAGDNKITEIHITFLN